MQTQGFLADLRHVLDLAIVWLMLALVAILFGWYAVWTRALGADDATALAQLAAVLNGTATRTVVTLFWLDAVAGASTTSLLCVWLFARWRHQAELRTGYVRGSRLEG